MLHWLPRKEIVASVSSIPGERPQSSIAHLFGPRSRWDLNSDWDYSKLLIPDSDWLALWFSLTKAKNGKMQMRQKSENVLMSLSGVSIGMTPLRKMTLQIPNRTSWCNSSSRIVMSGSSQTPLIFKQSSSSAFKKPSQKAFTYLPFAYTIFDIVLL